MWYFAGTNRGASFFTEEVREKRAEQGSRGSELHIVNFSGEGRKGSVLGIDSRRRFPED